MDIAICYEAAHRIRTFELPHRIICLLVAGFDLLHHAMHDRGLATTNARQDYCTAIALCSGDAYMSKLNWRSSVEFYKRVEGADITGFAWECLRRNPAFQRAQRTASPPGVSVSIEFRQQWGLVFRS
jgi:hypothetical protein